jgi:DNA invertase Pin-like site-specific DNA recombinase
MSRTVRNDNDVNMIEKGQYWNTALYIRLSREDGDKEESDSIGNQRDMLLSFISSDCQLKLFDIYIDDGYTGTNFNRPDFKRMVEDMKNRLVNCIILKDLSRFGRDYIGVGLKR